MSLGELVRKLRELPKMYGRDIPEDDRYKEFISADDIDNLIEEIIEKVLDRNNI